MALRLGLQFAERLPQEVKEELEQLVQSIQRFADEELGANAWKYLSTSDIEVSCPTPTNTFIVDPKSVYKYIRTGTRLEIHFNIFGTVGVGATTALVVQFPLGFDTPKVGFFTCQGDDGTVRSCYGYAFPSNYGSQPIGRAVFTVQRYDGVTFAVGALAISGQFSVEIPSEPTL